MLSYIDKNVKLMTFFSVFSVPPRVKLDLGQMINPRDLEEGDDVYFECSVTANPPAYKLTWWHNVSIPSYSLVKSSAFSGQIATEPKKDL